MSKFAWTVEICLAGTVLEYMAKCVCNFPAVQGKFLSFNLKSVLS